MVDRNKIDLRVMKEQHILNVISQCNGNKTLAAEYLGISYRTLTSTLKKIRERNKRTIANNPDQPVAACRIKARIQRKLDRIKILQDEIAELRKMIPDSHKLVKIPCERPTKFRPKQFDDEPVQAGVAPSKLPCKKS